MQQGAIVRLAMGTALLLLVPLLAMQFTDEVDWTLGDFVVAGVLVFGAGLMYQLVAPSVPVGAYRLAVGAVISATLLLLWVALAVGLP